MAAGAASSRARWVLAALAALAYAAASHALMTLAQDSPWSLAIVLGPLVVLGALGLWQAGRRALALLLALAAAGIAAGTPGGHAVLPSRWLYLAQHAGVHLALACGFAATLRRGATPLVSVLAAKVHGGLTPAMARYTRRVTVAWTLYFAAMAAASLLLFRFGDFAAWSVLANLLTPLATVAMFVGEYLLRYRLHPEFERVGLHKAWQAYRGEAAAAASAPATLDR